MVITKLNNFDDVYLLSPVPKDADRGDYIGIYKNNGMGFLVYEGKTESDYSDLSKEALAALIIKIGQEMNKIRRKIGIKAWAKLEFNYENPIEKNLFDDLMAELEVKKLLKI
jgi:hypothetical protein